MKDLQKQIEVFRNNIESEFSRDFAGLKKRFEELIIQADEQLNAAKNILDEKQNATYPDAALIDLLSEYIEILKTENEISNLTIAFLNLEIKQYEAVKVFSDLGFKFSDISRDIKEEMIKFQKSKIENQIKKLEKYTTGTKNRSAAKQQQWALAQLYFAEEIPKHRTLQSARKAAANRAGIKVNDRRLIEMLPSEK
ncbi:hypothetical protein METHB2_550024 [Candidatus Methylobacter favarea]|uniref:Uncharacterized protein n=1 Tax=Candidatus Methylobacter favarea TaxID=2707345 RepID=A0A8S0WBX4_9GAMM|nr:hypothetical protein [Candidatus Methylobacter favarea]CAA9892005.1 hypothetical protein METHB2_550024 [Candidatus Methylobacter favarea]